MTARAETWALTTREKLTSNVLAGLESSWDWTVATAFSFFFLFLRVSARLQQVTALVFSSDGQDREEGEALCSALIPAGRWAPASQLSLQHVYVPAHLPSISGSWWLTASLHSCCLPATEGEECLSLRNNMLFKLNSVRQSVSVHLSTKNPVAYN